jgi:hypothetical protein
VVRTLLPLVQQLKDSASLLMQPAAAAAGSAPAVSVQVGSSSSSCERQLLRALFATQKAASNVLDAVHRHKQLDAGVAAEVLRLQNDPAVTKMQLQLLTAWTALLHKQHTARQQQQQQAGTAGASSSSSSTQQQQQQPAKQQHRADLLSIPAFHQDMLQLLPGGQAYLDTAAEEAARWEFPIVGNAWDCCHSLSYYLRRHLQSTEGQQQISRNAVVVSSAAVRLAMELTLLAFAAVQRQREQQQQQQQQQRQLAFPPEDLNMDKFALHTWELLRLQIKALVATSRSCLPPEVLQQAGLQLLQALAAPLQQLQLSRTGDSFLQAAAATGALPLFGDTLQVLVAAACGAQPSHTEGLNREYDQ